MTFRNYDIAELRRLDVAHHLPAQTDYRLHREIGGSRIITRAEGCFIYDGEGNALLDAMAGLWCVQVGYGREELAEAAYDQMLELPYYNTFFKTAAPPTVTAGGQGRRAAGRRSSARLLQQLRLRGDRHRHPPRPLLLAGAAASRAATSSSPGSTAITARPSPGSAWAA